MVVTTLQRADASDGMCILARQPSILHSATELNADVTSNSEAWTQCEGRGGCHERGTSDHCINKSPRDNIYSQVVYDHMEQGVR